LVVTLYHRHEFQYKILNETLFVKRIIIICLD
jgi:hypothetical protein